MIRSSPDGAQRSLSRRNKDVIDMVNRTIRMDEEYLKSLLKRIL